MKLSACWIAKNEEKNLPRSMESVRDAADEMIVVDTGSTDDTVKIAEKLGARVSSFEWVNDFSAARNYAMELCEGEIVIFLDCDEWFEPALTAEDRERVLRDLAANPEYDAIQFTRHDLTDSGVVFVPVNRIFRKRLGLSYKQRIHEYYGRDDGKKIKAAWLDDWVIMHSGYVEGSGTAKSERNIPLLEQTTRDGDEYSAFRAHCYLVREYSGIGNDDALRHLRAVLDKPKAIKEICERIKGGFVELFRDMMDLAVRNLDKISVAEFDRKLIVAIEKNFTKNAVTPLIRPYWNYMVEGDEERLLLEVDGALAASRKLMAADKLEARFSTSLMLESRLLGSAAVAAELRGDTERAARYAADDLRTGKAGSSSLQVLLRCWRGTPLDKVKTRLAEIFPEMDAAELFFLAKHSGLDGYWQLSCDYANMLIERGAADDEIRFAAAIMSGRSDESQAIAKAAAERGTPANKTPPILFIGWTVAGALRDALRASYLLISGKYAELLEEFPADATRAKEHAIFRVHALIMEHRDVRAMTELLPLLGGVPADEVCLRYLAVLAERLTGELGETAEALLAMHRRFAGRMRVWGGLVRTGYAVDLYDRKTVRKLAALTEAELEASVLQGKRELANEELLDLAEKAGEIYEEKKMPAMALECWQFAFAHGRDGAETHMGRMIAALAKKRG